MKATQKDIEEIISIIQDLLPNAYIKWKSYRVGKGYMYTAVITIDEYPYTITAKGKGEFYQQLSLFKYGVCAALDHKER